MTDEVILQVKDLRTYFYTDAGVVKAVDGLTFDLHKGETLGLVGESGSGKSVTNLSIINLIQTPPGKIEGGEVLFYGEDLLKMSDARLREIRGDRIAMIFQDPMSSLNPYLRISTQMIETICLHQGLNKKAAKEKAIEMLKLTGIPAAEKRIDGYPHQFSGGMRQRVMIAMGLSCNPDILIADEPTSALDVTIQAQILDLMQDLTHRLGTAVILITHSLGVVAGVCDTIVVMYAGRIVERGTTEDIFYDTKHPYTQGLIKSVPRLDRDDESRLFSIDGQPPNVVDLPDCCPFYPRCHKALPVCKNRYPPVVQFSGTHHAACWLYAQKDGGTLTAEDTTK
ncbi:ABC transporter ATP-binding protein [Treponema socranskii]|uniref:Oligopeptide/dipeptide transporter, C-terminal domain protein n=1 Tax=Treponema socranskii subsp. socranskii VPI DR56BR1116 = ATCC 35536 TaxID=1125725 RepID=U2LJB2_TRESO|nr:ABC transporter ATP-binding protein [Treponema socranskii]ERF61390.1 oligopeptide/dipeptide transporter, C-terminal domain protein [Treponema socranskii subsp. socranskii VPI DR56BR1116 = ATCC 35536]ERK04523.1 oligopeptide/dipeptide transporter, C-terminal domain protein [Treponema socranskii subsp. socranskii VPI DR56BR1116 = ATCC 35536]MDR9858275.1 ABC transporter ATP-binding protein [Treponema socranskii]